INNLDYQIYCNKKNSLYNNTSGQIIKRSCNDFAEFNNSLVFAFINNTEISMLFKSIFNTLEIRITLSDAVTKEVRIFICICRNSLPPVNLFTKEIIGSASKGIR